MEFASGPTYCVFEKKKTLNDGSGIDVRKLPNGTYLFMSVCRDCGKKKAKIVSAATYNLIDPSGSSLTGRPSD